MASANAIAAVGQAILSLIAGAVPKDEFGSSRFELYQAKDFQAPMEEGISLYLYRITPAGEIRNYPPRVVLTASAIVSRYLSTSITCSHPGRAMRQSNSVCWLGDAYPRRHTHTSAQRSESGRA